MATKQDIPALLASKDGYASLDESALEQLHLMVNLSLQNTQNAEKLMPLGTLVVRAMVKHPDDQKMQLYGCLALNNLAINCKELPTWQPEATEHIDIMKVRGCFAKDKAIQQWARSYTSIVNKRLKGDKGTNCGVLDESRRK